jgi:hypothetical protein
VVRSKDMNRLPDSGARVPTLADRQAALAVALVTQADPPPGFDQVRLSRAGALLADKRAAAAATLLPALWRSLGSEAGRAFRTYVTAHSFPGDHAADALAFGARVCTGQSPAAAVREVLSLRLRSGWPVRVGRARRRVLVVARIARRPRCLELPWF